jgi:hypothetical protein
MIQIFNLICIILSYYCYYFFLWDFTGCPHCCPAVSADNETGASIPACLPQPHREDDDSGATACDVISPLPGMSETAGPSVMTAVTAVAGTMSTVTAAAGMSTVR